MLNNIFDSVFQNSSQTTVSVGTFLLCVGVSLVLGAAYYFAYSFRNRTSGSFRFAIALLPSVVCVVIMMVNGNVGVGVAVAGAFSLVRFRSAQGTAKEICVIFMAMCSGLMAGVGYLAYAALFTVTMCVIIVTANILAEKTAAKGIKKTLKITIPEDLDYEGVFDGVFDEFLARRELLNIKTTNLGSLFKLTYAVELKKGVSEKQFIDKLRVRNGNLEIALLKEKFKNDL